MIRRALRAALPQRWVTTLRLLRYSRGMAVEAIEDAIRASYEQGMDGMPFRYKEDGLATIHNCDFLIDPRFQKAYTLGESTGSWKGCQARWRAYVVCWCAAWASRLPGDFVECGVNQGGFARMILEYIEFEKTGKRFFLFDTFEGFPEKHILPEEAHVLSDYSYTNSLDAVRKTFGAFPSVALIQGPVPDTLADEPTQQVSFLSLDMNCVTPEIAAAEHFWPKMTPGGVIVLDDYGQSRHILQKRAFDEFARRRNTEVLCLPTSQGLIFKPREA